MNAADAATARRFDATPWIQQRWIRRLLQPIAVVVGFAAGAAVVAVPVGPQADAGQVVTLLQTAGFGALGLVSVVVSLLFLVVQWVSTTLSPRLILFRRSPLLACTIAAAVSLFTFALVTTVLVGPRPTVTALVPAVTGVWTLAVLGLLGLVQRNALRWVQVSSVLGILTEVGERAIDQVHPASSQMDPPRPVLAGDAHVVTWCRDGEVLQRLKTGPLLRAASSAGAVVVFRVPIGTPMRDRFPLADVYGAMADRTVREAAVTGTDRTFDQDPAFAMRLLADVALRALSAAVNDPATAVQALDAIHSMLQRAGPRDLSPIQLCDGAGLVRVVVPVHDWDALLTIGIDDVLLAVTAAQPMVLRRAEQMVTDLLDDMPACRRDALLARLDAVHERMPRPAS